MDPKGVIFDSGVWTAGLSNPIRGGVLVMDDDAAVSRAVRRALACEGLESRTVHSVSDARLAVAELQPACVITEVHLPDGSGVDFLHWLRESDPYTGRVVLTGMVDFLAVQDAVNRGAVHAFFTKPWDTTTLVHGIRSVLEQGRLGRENADLALCLKRRNEELAARVQDVSRYLDIAKRELEAVFDAWDTPLALVSPGLLVMRANLAFAGRAGIPVQQVPGRPCHELLFGNSEPCPACPVHESIRSRRMVIGRARNLIVTAMPVDAHRVEGPATLCRYEEPPV